jgi:hypothetical protein
MPPAAPSGPSLDPALLAAPSLRTPSPPAAPPSAGPAGAPLAPDDRFRPPALDSVAMQLEMDVPVAPVAAAPPAEAEAEPLPCPEHGLPEPCSACAERDAPIPGRIAQGALRKKPMVRLAIGLGAGLAIGYLASLPYASRAERRVALVRAEADQLRYKNAPELQHECARLDAKADDMSSSAAIVTGAIWLIFAGATVGGWYRLS